MQSPIDQQSALKKKKTFIFFDRKIGLAIIVINTYCLLYIDMYDLYWIYIDIT